MAAQLAEPVTIRPYRPLDHRACRDLWAELVRTKRELYHDRTIGGPDPGAGFEEYLTRLDLSGMWVAHHSDDGVVGFVGLILRGRAGAVEPVIVTEHRRDRGIGRALLEYVADQARGRGLRELSISPALRNAEAIHCLHRSGYDTAATVTLTLDLTGRARTAGEEIELHGVHFAY